MKEIMVSVIVPIYNAEKYLSKCIESILNQSMREIELILVDDGSKDQSGEICDKYAKKDHRVRVIHKENGGLSTARNTGIMAATGSHLSFVDADDYLDLDAYEEISKVIQLEDPDCIDFGWKYISESGEISFNLNKLEKEKLLTLKIIQDKILPPLLNLVDDKENFIFDFAVNKIYKKNIISKYQILFDEKRRTWEDRIFVVEYLKYCHNFYSMNRCYYNYVSVPNSLSRRYDPQFFNIILENYKKYKKMFGEKYNFDTDYVRGYWCHSIENMIFRSLKERENNEMIIKNIINILQNEDVVSWYKLRIPENSFEKEISEMIVDGQYKKAIEKYQKKISEDTRKNKFNTFKIRIKSSLKNFFEN